MKLKIFTTIYFVLMLALIFALAPVNQALADELPRIVVNFQASPLFADSNLMPGSQVARYARVTNNSGQAQKIIMEAINFANPIPAEDLSRVLTMEIKKDGETLYGQKGLNYFYTDGEIYLSDLADGQTAQYDVIISFDINTGNEWQERATGFDILVGFKGEEGGEPPVSSGGVSGTSTGSGGLPLGLSISGESVQVVAATPNSVTINWLTSYAATSQVIYALEGQTYSFTLADNAGTPPLYGYPFSTPEDMNKTMAHSVTITGLNPGATYYYRTVSHGSLAISQEHIFTTPALQAEAEILPAENPTVENSPIGSENPAPKKIVIAGPGQTGDLSQAFNQSDKAINSGAISGANTNALSSGNVLGTKIETEPAAAPIADNLPAGQTAAEEAGAPWAGIIAILLLLTFLGLIFIFWKKNHG